jgi:hypothetical protein
MSEVGRTPKAEHLIERKRMVTVNDIIWDAVSAFSEHSGVSRSGIVRDALSAYDPVATRMTPPDEKDE